MKCNIDRKGKLARLISGVIVTLAGVAIIIAAATGAWTGTWPWVIGGVVVAMGLFQIYEGWCGWCIMRAMGFKTPM